MILKWLSAEGNWHLQDGITDITDHGWMTIDDAREICKLYAGEEGFLNWNLDATTKRVAGDGDRYHLISAVVRNSRECMLIDDTQTYVCSDEGKTIDRFS